MNTHPLSSASAASSSSTQPFSPTSSSVTNQVQQDVSVSSTAKQASEVNKLFTDFRKKFAQNVLREFAAAPLVHANPQLGNRKFLDTVFAGFRLEQNVYKNEDAYISNSPVRSQIGTHLEESAQSRNVLWTESKGIAEAGLNNYATVPLWSGPVGLSASVNFSFSMQGSFCYRILQPHLIAKDKEMAQADEVNYTLPLTASAAKALPAGTEVELTGVGQLQESTNAIIGSGVPAANGLFFFGGAAQSIVTATQSGEYSTCITALNGSNKVRVVIRKINQADLALTTRIFARLVPYMTAAFPNWGGNGALQYLISNRIELPLRSLLALYNPLTIALTEVVRHKETVIASYEFDLNKPDAARSYEELIQLKPSSANVLSGHLDSGVKKAEFEETDVSLDETLDVTSFGERLFLTEYLRERQFGRYQRYDGSLVKFKGRILERVAESIFTGSSKIYWEGVDIQDEEDKLHSYCRFLFNKKSNDPDPVLVKNFFKLASELGIILQPGSQTAPASMQEYEESLSHRGDIKKEIDIFFTQNGIDKILSADDHTLMLSYLATLVGYQFPLLNAEHKEKALQFFEEYKREEGGFMAPLLGKGAKATQLEKGYKQLLGRSLCEDLSSYDKALQFVNIIKDNKNKISNIEQFFYKMGRCKELNYLEVLPTFMLLAGRENMLCHRLSIEAGGIKLKCKDDGLLKHPRDEVNAVIG